MPAGGCWPRTCAASRAAGGDAPHLTAVGHSYGSTTVGTALRATAPGWTTSCCWAARARAWTARPRSRPRPGHVWAGVGQPRPGRLPGPVRRRPDARGLRCGRASAPRTSARHPAVLAFADHSRYFAPGGESLDQRRAGRRRRRRCGQRGDLPPGAPWLPDGIAARPGGRPSPGRDRGAAAGDPCWTPGPGPGRLGAVTEDQSSGDSVTCARCGLSAPEPPSVEHLGRARPDGLLLRPVQPRERPGDRGPPRLEWW